MSKLFRHFGISTGFSFDISTIACRVSAGNFTRDYFHQLKRRRLNNSTALNNTRPSTGIYEEIDRYLALPCDDNVAPLLWWHAHFQEFPALGAMARDYLSIQATSVVCEQAFSVASNTITRTRNRLQSDTSRALLCSKSWLE